MKMNIGAALVGGFVMGMSVAWVVKSGAERSETAMRLAALQTHAKDSTNSLFTPALADKANIVTDMTRSKISLGDRFASVIGKGILSQSRWSQIFALINEINATNAREAVDAISKLKSNSEKRYLFGFAFANWAREDPKAAMDYANSLPKGSTQYAAILGALNGWVEIDLAAAKKNGLMTKHRV